MTPLSTAFLYGWVEVHVVLRDFSKGKRELPHTCFPAERLQSPNNKMRVV